MRRLVGPVLLLSAFGVQADIYKHVDENGHVTFTNKPLPGAKKVMLEASRPTSTRWEGRKSVKSGGDGITPASFPRVDASTQKKRDDTRRLLLEEELRTEQSYLDSARQALNQASRKPGGDLGRLGETVRLHEKNIEMLNKELASLK